MPILSLPRYQPTFSPALRESLPLRLLTTAEKAIKGAGLPDCKFANAAFKAIAIQAGLTCPITNQPVTEGDISVLAAELAMGRADYGMAWISAYRQCRREG